VDCSGTASWEWLSVLSTVVSDCPVETVEELDWLALA
jgi:hypothetical protein